MTKKESHTILFTITQEICCLHCGHSMDISKLFPIGIDTFCGLMKGFEKDHKRCKLTEGGMTLQRRLDEERKKFNDSKFDNSGTV